MTVTKNLNKSPGFRDRILQAALSVFAEYGFTGASTREIARRANVHQPAIAYYFSNKERLWKEAIDTVFSNFMVTLEQGLQDIHDDESRLRVVVEIFVRYVARHPEWAKFVIQEGMQKNPRNQWLIKKWLRPHFKSMFEALFQEPWPLPTRDQQIQAISKLSVLTGSTLVFAEQVQVKGLANINTHSEQFIEAHVNTVYTCMKVLAAG